MDNRLGAYVALEARAAHERGGVAGRLRGGRRRRRRRSACSAARDLGLRAATRPAIAVDVTHATDAPGSTKKELGDHPLGSGPGDRARLDPQPEVFELLLEAAEAEGIDVHASRPPAAGPAPTPTRSSSRARASRRPGLDPAALHALAGRAGRPRRRRGHDRLDRGVHPPPRPRGVVLCVLKTAQWPRPRRRGRAGLLGQRGDLSGPRAASSSTSVASSAERA